MRRRELIKRLRSDNIELRVASSGLLGGRKCAQEKTLRRLEILHGLENLLPEIIKKLESQP